MYDESKPEPIVEPDTDNNTEFYGNDLYADTANTYRLDGSRKLKNHYDRLSRHNRGVVGKWYDQTERRRQDNLLIFDAVANNLELPEYLRRVGRIEFQNVPLRDWSSPNGIDVVLVSVMICAVVLLKDPRSGRVYNPDRADKNQDPLFLTLFNSLSYRGSVTRSCYQKTLQHVGWTPVDWTDYEVN